MKKIQFTREETERIVRDIKTYFRDELDQDIGGFEAEFLMGFMAKQIGPAFYNRGLNDALALFSQKADEISYQLSGAGAGAACCLNRGKVYEISTV